MLSARARQVNVVYGWVSVFVAGEIATACQEDFLESTDFFLVEPRACADVAHGVATTAHWAGVGVAAMDQLGVVKACLVGLQLNRHRSL